MNSKTRLVSLAVISCLVLSGCSIIPIHNPQQKNYAATFSLDSSRPFLTTAEGQYQTQFDVNVSDWSQNYDKQNCEVFIIVTDKDHVPITDLETNTPNDFSYGGWFNLDVENRALKSLGLQPFSTQKSTNNWFNILKKSQATSKFIARSNKPVNPNDWRFVIMAIRAEHGVVKVLWTKLVSPS